jgi:ribosomal protein S18 acetylase RimI-like enzyme
VLHDRPEGPFTVARRFCEIDQIAVDPARRGQGIARALMLEALARARADGIDEIEASSWSFNESAHAMFRHLGFVPKTVRFELTGESS